MQPKNINVASYNPSVKHFLFFFSPSPKCTRAGARGPAEPTAAGTQGADGRRRWVQQRCGHFSSECFRPCNVFNSRFSRCPCQTTWRRRRSSLRRSRSWTRCWRWWSSGTPWWPSWMSSVFVRRRRTRTWRLSCSPRASTSTGLERVDSWPDQNSLLNACSSECVKIPPPPQKNTHKHHDCHWHCSSLLRLHILCPKAVLVNHFAVLLALSLCGWRGEHIHSFIIPALKWILSAMRKAGTFGRLF